MLIMRNLTNNAKYIVQELHLFNGVALNGIAPNVSLYIILFS